MLLTQKTEEVEPARAPLATGASLDGGRYKVERLLGEGGFALTYLARQGRWQFAVCIKEFFPLGCERRADGVHAAGPHYQQRLAAGLQAFTDEAAALARFNHPGIVRVLGSFAENRTAYLVQEVLQGMTLGDGLAMAGKMDAATVLKVAQQVGQALLMVHAAGLVHSDLKPENIFLTREGRYVLLDFGLTRGFLSAAGAQKGGRGLSAGYSPPEQYIPGTVLTPATDVYGFAATLYCLLTGLAPPDAHQRSLGQPLPDMRPLNGSVTQRLERSLQNALHLDVARRTPGIREFLYQLGLDCTPKAVAYRPTPFTPRSSERAHPTGVTGLALHGDRLYSAGREGQVKVWKWPHLELLATAQTHQAAINALAVSRDGQYLVTSTEGGEIKLQPTSLDHPGLVLSQENSMVTHLAFHGNLIAAALADGGCCLLGPTLPAPVRWVAHAGLVNSLDFHPDGTILVTGGGIDRMVRFWELPEPRVVHEFSAHDKGIQTVAFSPDGCSLLTASQDQSLKFWDLIAREVVREMRGHNAAVSAATFGCDDQMVISLGGDHHLRAFHLSSSRVAFCSEARSERTRALVADRTRRVVATGTRDGSIAVWEFSSEVAYQAQADVPAADEAPLAEEEVDVLVGSRLGDYLLAEQIGSGGMARVYKATAENGQQVAIKVIRPDQVSPEFQQRFEREIKVSMKLDHPNVLQTLDWGRQENLTYLVMEFVEGQTLKEIIPAGGLTIPVALPLLSGIVDALAHAHELGIVHRDVKPENVMISSTGLVKLMDFGLARDKEVKTVTRPGSAIGTAEYMAPEQVLRGPDRSVLTDKTDQYALGILVFELLTGRRPFEWNDPVKLITMHLTQAPPQITGLRADLPAAVEPVLERMLRKELEERYESVRDAASALFAALS